MDLEETVAVLLSKNEQLRRENDELRLMMSLVKENRDLRARMLNLSNDDPEECSVNKPPSQFQDTCDEGIFRKDFQQANLKHEHRTSSPMDFRSFIQSSVYPDTSQIQSIRAETSSEVKGPERILGEIAYQLDKRIVSHVFEGRRRVYGFTVHNIPDKIIEVSTHPLTGEVDEGYRLHLTKRYNELLESLTQLGYKTTLHPTLAEFIVNTYGVLRRSDVSTQEINNSDFLRQLVTTTAPQQLQKDLLILLTCLCNMAEKDKRPIYLF